MYLNWDRGHFGRSFFQSVTKSRLYVECISDDMDDDLGICSEDMDDDMDTGVRS